MIPVITFFHDSVPPHNWGLAIVLLTLTVKLVLYPLNAKQFKSMRVMQQLQPRFKALQEQYKDKKSPEQMQEMQAKMMGLYKEHNTTPLSGCLPLLVQLPVLMALYYSMIAPVIIDAIYLGPSWERSFIFIRSLLNMGAYETYVTAPLLAPHTYSLIHWDNVALIAIYTITSYVTQKTMTTNPDDPMQKQMLLMSLMLGPLFGMFMPSGVLLYIVVSSAFTIGQYQILQRQFPKDGASTTAMAAAMDGSTMVPKRVEPATPAVKSASEPNGPVVGMNGGDITQLSRAARRRSSRKPKR